MKHYQSGITLVELMIALLLGLILSLAAVQLLLTNQRTFSLQDAVTSLNEDGQIVLRYIASDIRNAGRGGADIGFIQPVVLDVSVDNESGDSISFSAEDGGNNGNDTLVVSYLGLSACQGSDLTQGGARPEGDIVVNRYYVEGGSLRCSSLRQLGPSSGYELLAPDSVELLSGVESFQVLYGVDNNPNEELGATSFVTADALSEGSVVVAIRVGILLRSNETNLPVPSGSRVFNVLDQVVQSPDDRALRRVFTTTTQVRNVFWGSI